MLTAFDEKGSENLDWEFLELGSMILHHHCRNVDCFGWKEFDTNAQPGSHWMFSFNLHVLGILIALDESYCDYDEPLV